jgi:hypothetical protein
MRIFQEALGQQEREKLVTATVSAATRRQQQDAAAAKRAKRIEKLEAELARLRAEDANDTRPD